jgi:hypothetical protein
VDFAFARLIAAQAAVGQHEAGEPASARFHFAI